MGVDHWEHVYEGRADDELSWFEPDPLASLRFVDAAIVAGARSVIDVGGGSSALVDALLDRDLDRVAVLDVSAAAIARSSARLGARASRVEWITGDVLDVPIPGTFDVWHDRALLHFLTEPGDRDRYVARVRETASPNGFAIIAAFGPDGPERCSGLPVARYSATDLAGLFRDSFRTVDSSTVVHTTPRGIAQQFVYVMLHREA